MKNPKISNLAEAMCGYHIPNFLPHSAVILASDCHFRWFESDFQSFCEAITGKNNVEELEAIICVCVEWSSP